MVAIGITFDFARKISYSTSRFPGKAMFKRTFCLIFIAGALAGCASRGPLPPESAEAPAANAAAPPDVLSSEVALYALSQLGVPYAFGGASPQAGFDCSGLVRYVFQRTRGVDLPRTTFELARVGRNVAAPGLQPGDLVFFNTLRREFSHVGIYLGEERFIHAPATGGVVRIENLRTDYWLRRFNGARRLSI
jgi:cell wall-associated NlpC family hydrolase